MLTVCTWGCSDSPEVTGGLGTDGSSEGSAGSEDATEDETGVQWERSFPAEGEVNRAVPLGLATASNGRVHVVALEEDEVGRDHLVVLTYDTEGELSWMKRSSIDGKLEDAALAVDQGRIAVVAGVGDVGEHRIGGYHAVWVYEADGTLRWSVFSPPETFGGNSAGVALVGADVIVASTSHHTFAPGDGTRGALVAAYRDGGSLGWRWSHAVDYSSGAANAVVVRPDLGVFVAAVISSEGWMIRLGTDGSVIWQVVVDEEKTADPLSLSWASEASLFVARSRTIQVLDLDGVVHDRFELDEPTYVTDHGWRDGMLAATGWIDGGSVVVISDRYGSVESRLVEPVMGSSTTRAQWLPGGELALLGTVQSETGQRLSIARFALPDPRPTR